MTIARPMSDLSGVAPAPLAASSLTSSHHPSGALWLDIGCGTSLFTELIFDTRSPAAAFAIDAMITDFEAL